MKLKLHSAVNVITNSSTVIYTQATEGVIDGFKKIVNIFLQQFDECGYTADDLFTFSLEWQSDRVENWRWQKVRNTCESREKAEVLYKEYEINNPSWWNDFEPSCDNPCDRYLKVEPKQNEKVAEWQKELAELFEEIIDRYDQEAYYNG